MFPSDRSLVLSPSCSLSLRKVDGHTDEWNVTLVVNSETLSFLLYPHRNDELPFQLVYDFITENQLRTLYERITLKILDDESKDINFTFHAFTNTSENFDKLNVDKNLPLNGECEVLGKVASAIATKQGHSSKKAIDFPRRI